MGIRHRLDLRADDISRRLLCPIAAARQRRRLSRSLLLLIRNGCIDIESPSNDVWIILWPHSYNDTYHTKRHLRPVGEKKENISKSKKEKVDFVGCQWYASSQSDSLYTPTDGTDGTGGTGGTDVFSRVNRFSVFTSLFSQALKQSAPLLFNIFYDTTIVWRAKKMKCWKNKDQFWCVLLPENSVRQDSTSENGLKTESTKARKSERESERERERETSSLDSDCREPII